MTAIEDARAALADLRAGIPQRGDYPEYDREHEDLDKIAALIAEHERLTRDRDLTAAENAELLRENLALTAPPTDDEREALAGIAREAWAHYQAIQDDPEFGGDFEDVLAYRLGLAGFRRQGPITDAQYIAARDAYEDASSGHVVTEVAMRAALEAARGA